MAVRNLIINIDEDYSKNILIKIGMICIVIILILNSLVAIMSFVISDTDLGFLFALINSGLGIIVGAVIFESAGLFKNKIGEYAGIAKIIFDLISLIFNLFYNRYLNELYNSLFFILMFFGVQFIANPILLLFIPFLLATPGWVQNYQMALAISDIFKIALLSYYFYLIGKEKNNTFFKMTSISIVLSYLLWVVYSIYPNLFLYLSSIFLENIFLLISFKIISEFRFLEDINPYYKPIETEYK